MITECFITSWFAFGSVRVIFAIGPEYNSVIPFYTYGLTVGDTGKFVTLFQRISIVYISYFNDIPHIIDLISLILHF